MRDWLSFTFLSLGLWGLWAFFSKMAALHVSYQNILLYSWIGFGVGLLIVFLTVPAPLSSNAKGIVFSVLIGLSAVLGSIFFFLALAKGPTPLVVTISALYPAIALLLSFLVLHETITLRQGIGIVFGLLAMGLIAG